TLLLHARRRVGEAEGVPRLERSELPAVTPAHRVVDRRDRVGDLGDAARGVGERAGENLPRELPGLAGIGEELPHALARVLELRDALRGVADSRVAGLRAVLELLRVEGLEASVLGLA